MQRLGRDLQHEPRALGLSSAQWSGASLARHVAGNYAIPLSERRCRTLLRNFGVESIARAGAPHVAPMAESSKRSSKTSSVPALRPLHITKEIALRRIRRLAVSGLAIEPFVRTLFEIVRATLPLAENQTFLADPRPPYIGYISNNAEVVRRAALNRQLVIEGGPEVSGARDFNSPDMLRKTVWMHDEVALPHWYQSPGYNEVHGPLGMHHCMVVVFAHEGNLIGRWPMWRSSGMPAWSHDDACFMAATAPFITHGLRLAQLVCPEPAPCASFIPLRSSEPGSVLLDLHGRVLALDHQAHDLFAQLGLFDQQHAFTSGSVKEGLNYVAGKLRDILARDNTPLESAPPSVRVWMHHTGVVLRLRGSVLDGTAGRPYLVVMVERGEIEAVRRQRLMLSWGLSPQEYEILRLLAAGCRRSEIAATLHIAIGTLKTHLRRLAEKLNAESYDQIRARSVSLFGSGSSLSEGERASANVRRIVSGL